MKIVIQDASTLMFFSGEKLNYEVTEAVDYPSRTAAIRVMSEKKLHPAQVVAKFEDLMFELMLCKSANPKRKTSLSSTPS